MYHGLNNSLLYSAYKLNVGFINQDSGITKDINGTCFFVKNTNDEIFLITNRHMLDFYYNRQNERSFNISYIKATGKKYSPTTDLPDSEISLNIIPNITFDEDVNNDVVCIKNPRVLNSGDVTISYTISNALLANEEDFQKRLSICDFLAFPGYPPGYDLGGNRPILRTGTISSDPRYDYSYDDNERGACVAYEAFSFGGSSGSPVFAVQKGPEPGPGISFPGFRRLMLVGINAGHLQLGADGQHSGISYFYKSTVIDRLINR